MLWHLSKCLKVWLSGLLLFLHKVGDIKRKEHVRCARLKVLYYITTVHMCSEMLLLTHTGFNESRLNVPHVHDLFCQQPQFVISPFPIRNEQWSCVSFKNANRQQKTICLKTICLYTNTHVGFPCFMGTSSIDIVIFVLYKLNSAWFISLFPHGDQKMSPQGQGFWIFFEETFCPYNIESTWTLQTHILIQKSQ